jgi:3-hydroxyacyl-[acyl-carrier-protein] dehydratase
MRWFWVDRFIELESGRRAKAIKNVSLAEEHVSDHFPGAPLMPGSIIIEGLAQTGGLLVGEANDFEMRVVLAKISKIEFFFQATVGDTLIYTADLDDLSRDGGIVSATSHVGERLQARAQLCFAHLTEPAEPKEMWDPAQFATLLRVLNIYDVGRTADGKPLEMPKRYREAERRAGL